MILEEWISDIPYQFQDKEKIVVLIEALARQLEELVYVFEEVNTKTNLDTAVGANLDYVGDIMGVTRKDASDLLKDENGRNIDDATYRNVLRYKAISNSSNGTYKDLMKSIALLNDGKTYRYEERSNKPATIVINVNAHDENKMDLLNGGKLVSKASGVDLLYSLEDENDAKVYCALSISSSMKLYPDPSTYPTKSPV